MSRKNDWISDEWTFVKSGEMLSRNQVEKALGLSRRGLYVLRKRHKFAFDVHVGSSRALMFRADDILRLRDERAREARIDWRVKAPPKLAAEAA